MNHRSGVQLRGAAIRNSAEAAGLTASLWRIRTILRTMKSRLRRPGHRTAKAAIAMLAAAGLLLAGCQSHRGLPSATSKAYDQFVSAFYVGLSALQVGNDALADTSLRQATQIAPGEPAAWTDWGILALRQRNFEPAADRFNRALKLVPRNGRIYFLLGLLNSSRGDSQASIEDYRKAVGLDSRDPHVLYALALAIERQGAAGSEERFQQLIEQILAVQPDNLAALVELSRISAKRGDVATLRAAVQRISAQSATWPPDVKQQFAALQAAASGANPSTAALRSVFLRNVLMQVPAFRASLSEIMLPPGDQAQPFTRFLRLASPSSTPAPADTAIQFESQPVPMAGNERNIQHWSWIGSI